MKRPIGGILGIVLGGFLLGLSGCAAIDAGHEGVLVEQPFFFGHGCKSSIVEYRADARRW